VSEFGPLFRFSFVHALVSIVTIVARIWEIPLGKNRHCEKTHTLGSNNTKQNKIIFISTMTIFLWFHQLSIGCGYILSYLHAKVIFFLEAGCRIFDSSKRFM